MRVLLKIICTAFLANVVLSFQFSKTTRRYNLTFRKALSFDEFAPSREDQLLERLETLQMKYDSNVQKRTLWAKDYIESHQFIETLRNLVLSSLILSTQIEEDIQYYAIRTLVTAHKINEAWISYLSKNGITHAKNEHTFSSLKLDFKSLVIRSLHSIGRKANEALDMAYEVRDDTEYFSNAMLHQNKEGKVQEWVPTIKFITVMIEHWKKYRSMTKKITSFETINKGLLASSLKIGNIWKKFESKKKEITSLETINVALLAWSTSIGKYWKRWFLGKKAITSFETINRGCLALSSEVRKYLNKFSPLYEKNTSLVEVDYYLQTL